MVVCNCGISRPYLLALGNQPLEINDNNLNKLFVNTNQPFTASEKKTMFWVNFTRVCNGLQSKTLCLLINERAGCFA